MRSRKPYAEISEGEVIETMSLKIVFEEGNTLESSLFVATEGEGEGAKQAAIRASKLLDPKLHKLASQDDDDAKPKLAVQPEQIIQDLANRCQTLDEFKAVAYNIAANHSLEVTAAAEDKPVWATEEPTKVTVGKEPVSAAEALPAAGTQPTEARPDVKRFLGRLPGRALGAPTMAIDLQSRARLRTMEHAVKAAEEKAEQAEKRAKDAESKFEAKVKEGSSDKVIALMTKLGAIEDEKDKQSWKSKLAKIAPEAMAVFEEALKVIQNACEEMGAKEPKNAAYPTGGERKASVRIPRTEDNVIEAAIVEDGFERERLDRIAQAWAAQDERKSLVEAR